MFEIYIYKMLVPVVGVSLMAVGSFMIYRKALSGEVPKEPEIVSHVGKWMDDNGDIFAVCRR